MPNFYSLTLATIKLTSTAALGILTGAHLTLSLTTLPALLALPSAQQARNTFTALTTRTPTSSSTTRTSRAHNLRLNSILPLLPSALLTLAYLVSPRRLAHPYLLLAAALPAAAAGYEAAVLRPLEGRIAKRARSVPVDEELDAVNGEAVRGEMERYRVGGLVRAGLVGVGFLVGLVGNWGDGWAVYQGF